MSQTRVARTLIVEGIKLVVIVMLVFTFQNGLFDAESTPTGDSDHLRQAHAEFRESLADTSQHFRSDVRNTANSLSDVQKQLDKALVDLQRQRSATSTALESRIGKLQNLVEDRLRAQSELASRSRDTSSANRELLDRIQRTLDRDPSLMKRMMLRPTAQLRGNGTVGSGVLVYSEAQSTASDDTVVYTSFVLTAHHVVVEVAGDDWESGVVKEVYIPKADLDDDPNVFEAKVVLSDRERDLALLRLNSRQRFPNLIEFMSSAELSSVGVFSPAYAVGCPLGNRPLPTLGEVSSRSKTVGEQTFWMLSAPTFFGNSGGGVYLANTCELIGISSMIYTYGKRSQTVVPHMGLFVPLQTIYDWLDAEGFEFLHERRSIPEGLTWKLVYDPDRGATESPFAGTFPELDED